MNCPRCAVPLEARKLNGALDYGCLSCDGHAVTLGALRKRAEKPTVSGLWRMAASSLGAGEGPGCPSCSQSMTVLTLSADDLKQLGAPPSDEPAPLVLDVCRGCYLVWFDWAEQERLAGPAPAPPTAAEVEADRLMAGLKAESKAEQQRTVERGERGIWRARELVDALFTLLW